MPENEKDKLAGTILVVEAPSQHVTAAQHGTTSIAAIKTEPAFVAAYYRRPTRCYQTIRAKLKMHGTSGMLEIES